MEGANFLKQGRKAPGATSREAKTLILFGRVGNGKSAVGNSILGKKEFASRIDASCVTTECQMETTMLDDGQVVNVIDTPGLFDPSKGSDYYIEEMDKSITLAKDGIHGFLLVCSIRTRFSTEEESVLRSLGEFFGKEIINYMIIIFTGGDDLDTTFNEYLSKSPPSLQRVLQLCKNRSVLFDNKTRDESQRKKQVQQLMSLVNKVKSENGQPYKVNEGEMRKREERILYEAQQRQNEYLKQLEAQQKQLEAQIALINGAQSKQSEIAEMVQQELKAKIEQLETDKNLYQQEKVRYEILRYGIKTLESEPVEEYRSRKRDKILMAATVGLNVLPFAAACTIM
ncbi:hypothetical protein MKW92_037176 [Papaver armeniacum]|nr:hypothetical protein MKW92_037176 [Papaver armeniacum]